MKPKLVYIAPSRRTKRIIKQLVKDLRPALESLAKK